MTFFSPSPANFLSDYLREAGFEEVQEVSRESTLHGSLGMFKAVKAGHS